MSMSTPTCQCLVKSCQVLSVVSDTPVPVVTVLQLLCHPPAPEYRGFFCQKLMFILFVLIFTQFFQHKSETLRDVGVPEIRVPHLPSSS